ncbi:MAG: V-type ATPase subunit [Firmicutes bacterium]|nr:V-type ATPase subunit [Bacillota bacterium]
MWQKEYPVLSQDSDFVHGNSQLALLEKELISQSAFEQYQSASDLQDLAKLLSDTVYAGKIESCKTIDKLIEDETIRFRDELYSLVPEKKHNILDAFFRKYDYNNLKICLKTILAGRELNSSDLSTAGTMTAVEIIGCFDEERKDPIPFDVDIEEIKNLYKKEREMRSVDALCDKAYYKELVETIGDTGDEFLTDYIRQMIDLKNILIFIRCKNTGLPQSKFLLSGGYISTAVYDIYESEAGYEAVLTISDFQPYREVIAKGIEALRKTDSYAELETSVRNYFLVLISDLQDSFFSMKPFIGYMLAKEHELGLIKKLYIHIKNRIPFGKEKDRLYYA